MTKQYRINDNVLLKLNTNLSERKSFYKFAEVANSTQFLSEEFNNDLVTNETNLDKTVWKLNQRLNRVFNSVGLLNYSNLTVINNQKIITGSLLIRQGFSWEGVFGILLVVKTMGNQLDEKILISQIFDINSFKFDFDNSKELINGTFWTKNIKFMIPDFEENLMVSVETIKFTDIETDGIIGKIYNYPLNDNSYEPLISESPIPDFIQTKVTLTNNQYLKIEPITLEPNKTIEQSILDYFGLTDNLVPITVEHVINYGTEEIGFKTYRISNEDYKFNPIVIGLDLTGFDSVTMTVFVSTEIVCNSKLMKREQNIIFDYSSSLNPILANLVLSPEFVYPVVFETVNNIQNTIIESKTETKLVPIFQPVFVEMIKEDIVFENKNISFEDIKISAFMIIDSEKEQYIVSKITNDGSVHFDLGTLIKPEKDCNYTIIDSSTKRIIKKGKLLIKSN